MTRTRRALVALLLVPVLSSCSGLGGTNDGGYIPGDGGVVEFGVDEREPPVDLSGPTTTGDEFTLERGKVAVVNVWWSGCGPCIQEMPMLTELDAAYDGDVTFVGINVKDTSPENARAFEVDRGVEYPSIYDPRALLAFTGRTSPRATPTTLVLDPDGVVVSLISGPIPSRTTLAELVEDAGGPPAPAPASPESREEPADG
jgi:thiol-disulfide isomerase/thioredoxin